MARADSNGVRHLAARDSLHDIHHRRAEAVHDPLRRGDSKRPLAHFVAGHVPSLGRGRKQVWRVNV